MSTFITAQFMCGNVFFVGLALAIVGLTLRIRATAKRWQSAAFILSITGALLVALSGTPLPIWAYLIVLASLASSVVGVSRKRPWAHWASAFTVGAFAAAGAWESLYHMPVTIPVAGYDTLFVVGDSLSMGADPPGKSWPELLADKAHMKAKNFSFGGAKVASAQHNAERIDKDDALVILEIGGNDLLSGEGGFYSNLDQMLRTVCSGKRSVAMLELPLPPLFNSYGMAQRQLAAKYGVTLIPKRYLTRVLTTPGATVDGLHLSNTGHALLAETIFELFATAPPADDN
jgi:lysophospholipase L1-like esterase